MYWLIIDSLYVHFSVTPDMGAVVQVLPQKMVTLSCCSISHLCWNWSLICSRFAHFLKGRGCIWRGFILGGLSLMKPITGVFCRGTHYTDCVCCGQTFLIQMITQIAFICSMLCTAICMPNAIPIIQVHISNKCSLLFAWLFFIMFDIDFLEIDTAQAYVKCMLWSILIWWSSHHHDSSISCAQQP